MGRMADLDGLKTPLPPVEISTAFEHEGLKVMAGTVRRAVERALRTMDPKRRFDATDLDFGGNTGARLTQAERVGEDLSHLAACIIADDMPRGTKSVRENPAAMEYISRLVSAKVAGLTCTN